MSKPVVPLVSFGAVRSLLASFACCTVACCMVTCCVITIAGVAPSSAADLSAAPWLHKLSLRSASSASTPAAKAAARTRTAAKASTLVLPDPALLTPLRAPDCAFKGTMGTPPTAEELRQKLDYEAQCWRQSEGIARARLDALQEAVRQMIKGTAARDAVASANE